MQCSNYGKKGHLSKNCWSKLRNKEKAHVAQPEEEELALFMVSALVLSDVPNSDSKPMKVIDNVTASVSVIDEGSIDPEEELQLGGIKAPAGEPIQLKEERVFTQIGERGEEHEHRRWVLDTGATNHMIGASSAFSKLDSGIYEIVKFSDGSVVDIEVRSTILFVDKGGEHRKLTSVYFISRLKANIVSLCQLDEVGCTFHRARATQDLR